MLVVAADELTRGILALHLGELSCEVWAAAETGEAKSLLADRRQGIEALVIDLAGSSATPAWIQQVAAKLPVVAVLSETPGDPAITASERLVPLPQPVTAENLRQALLGAAHN